MYRNSKLALLTACVLGCYAMHAQAVDVMPINIESAPGQDFKAKFDLRNVDERISIRIASPETYQAYGLKYPEFLRHVKLFQDPNSKEVRLRLSGEVPTPSQAFPLLLRVALANTNYIRFYNAEYSNGTWLIAMDNWAYPPGTQLAVKPVAPSMFDGIQKMEQAQLNEEIAKAQATYGSEHATKLAKEAQAVTNAALQEAQRQSPSVVDGSLTNPTQPAEQSKAQEQAAAASEPAVKTVTQPLTPMKKGAVPAIETEGRTPAEIVDEYVTINGFDINKGFEVLKGMSLWSIAKHYAPFYKGATIDQIIVALKEKNPNAFKGKHFALVEGQVLQAPTADEVFGVDPMQAFKAVHGEGVEPSGVTKNLIKAQEVSPELAAKVAEVQDSLLKAGRSEKTIVGAGMTVLNNLHQKTTALAQKQEQQQAQQNADQATNGDAQDAENGKLAPNEVPPRQGLDAREVESDPAEAHSIKNAENAIPANARPLNEVFNEKELAQEDSKKPSAQAAQAASHAEPEAKSEEASSAAAATRSDPQGKGESSAEGKHNTPTGHIRFDDPNAKKAIGGVGDLLQMGDRPWYWLLLIPFLIFILWRTLRKVNERPKTPSVAGEMQAQTQGENCESGTCANKNGIKIEKNVQKTSEAQIKAVTATVDECVKNGTTAGAMGVGAMAYTKARQEEEAKQPWLAQDSDELPPLDEEEVASDPKILQATAKAMEGVDLSLEPEDKAEAEVKTSATAPAPAAQAATAEKAEVEKADATATKASKEDKPLNANQQVHHKALDAKLKLAQQFAKQGDKTEAIELLDEVIRRGSEDQQQQAEKLLATLKK